MPSLRESALARLKGNAFDVVIIGGGINGAVPAACLAARGAKVALIDRGDFASATSQESSNLAWGGIKYMESLEFRLVRKLCASRNHLIRSYPSTVKEIRFFAVHTRGFRHGLLKLVLGTWLYWLLGSFFTKRPRLLTMRDIRRDEPLVELDSSDGGFEYSDAYLHDNDARFVWNFVRRAIDYGASCVNYVEGIEAIHGESGWKVAAKDVVSGEAFTLAAKVLVNACGPFADAMNERSGVTTRHRHVFSKGIHLIVPRLSENKRVLTFFADDGRLFFVIPMGPRTCIGTTDTKVEDPRTHVTPEDRRFVLDNINKRLRLPVPLTERDIIAERCGARPLAVLRDPKGAKKSVDWMQLSRKHAIDVDVERRHLSVFGGKLTDCLNVGEELFRVVSRLGIAFSYPSAVWYGEPGAEARAEFMHRARLMGLDAMTSSRSSEPLTARLWRRYGEGAFALLEDILEDPTKAEVLIDGAEYLRCEIEHAARREMIVCLEDFLRRRSKIALVVGRSELHEADGLKDACALLFGGDAERRFAEYFGEDGAQAKEAAQRAYASTS